MENRRVVVTGMGIVSPIGNDLKTVWTNLINGKSGIDYIKNFDTSDFPIKIGGEVKSLSIDDYLTVKEQRKLDIFVQYGLIAAIDALSDAKFDFNQINLESVGVIAGSGIGGMDFISTNHTKLSNKGAKRVSPYFVPGGITNVLPGVISIRYGFKGPNFSIVSACSTGSHNIGVARDMIRSGYSDVMIAGGSEKGVLPLNVAGFFACRALSHQHDDPTKVSRPWDNDRDGFVVSEGAGIVVLEEYEHAKKRGAHIYAELLGFGMSADACHITSPDSSGEGPRLCIQNALTSAKLNPEDIEHINAHSTSTQIGDEVELKAIRKTFGEHCKNIAINSTKSMTGHLLGAAGSTEAIFSILSLNNNMVPPTINLHNSDIARDLNLVPNQAQEKNLKYALSNSFGFGGTNSSLIFSKV